jgi:hypothetical protein
MIATARMKVDAATPEEASAIYSAAREGSGEGASTWPEGEWQGHRISYNGKVWDGEWPNARLVFSPYA